MRLDFLCPHHRRALLEAPHGAAGVWRDCDRRLRDGASLPPPTRLGLAGSALEAADIYLSALYLPAASGPAGTVHAADAFLLERYATSALRLMDMLCRVGQRRLALVVLAGANAMVEQVSRAGADVHAALHACRRLTRDGMRLLGNGETSKPGETSGPQGATAAVAVLH